VQTQQHHRAVPAQVGEALKRGATTVRVAVIFCLFSLRLRLLLLFFLLVLFLLLCTLLKHLVSSLLAALLRLAVVAAAGAAEAPFLARLH
jgi:hypothetical protein